MTAAGAFIGLGTDLVEVERFRQAVARRTSIVDRLFSDGEQAYAATLADAAPSLAVRFAAKEAVMKALGVGLGSFAFRDVEVVRADDGSPTLALRDRAAALAAAKGVRAWHVSLSHTDTTALAVTIALS